MRILHTYCLNYNIGDYALGLGLKNLLRANLEVKLIGNTNIQGRQFDEYFIKEVVNKRYDLLVIGGGGIIHGAHWPNGWFWLIDKDLIQEIKIPFVVYGVGYNYWEEEGGIPERGKAHLLETKKYASYFSVRNDGSAKRLLDQTGINAEVIPDPGFHIDLNTKYERIVEESYILIQVANDKPLSRFGSIEKQQKFIREIRTLTQELAKKYKVILAPHVLEDVEISKTIVKEIHNAEVWDFGHFAFDNIKEAISYYKYAEFVIAMRGHGQILPIGFGTPVISLENHPKHRGLMSELDLLDYNVNINKDDFLVVLSNQIKDIQANNTNLKEKYKRINRKLNIDSQNAFVKIIEKINLQ